VLVHRTDHTCAGDAACGGNVAGGGDAACRCNVSRHTETAHVDRRDLDHAPLAVIDAHDGLSAEIAARGVRFDAFDVHVLRVIAGRIEFAGEIDTAAHVGGH